ncbi:MAG: helix-turn-helix transcriptional regulator [Treponematales bacterium]
MDLARIFIGNMKKYRKKAGISQEKLAELCESSHSHIRQIECGNRSPSFSFIGKLSAALRVPPSLLFADEKGENAHETLKKEQIETELAANVLKNIHAAFARL